jgi:hypothetical protein
MPGRSVAFGERLRFVVGVKLDKLSPEDVQIELLLSTALKDLRRSTRGELPLQPEGKVENGEQRYVLEVPLEAAGSSSSGSAPIPTTRRSRTGSSWAS